jgi:hypothetical protein
MLVAGSDEMGWPEFPRVSCPVEVLTLYTKIPPSVLTYRKALFGATAIAIGAAESVYGLPGRAVSVPALTKRPTNWLVATFRT